jgi:cation diffusion facilitator family transporter
MLASESGEAKLRRGGRGRFPTSASAARLLLITVVGLFALKVVVGVVTGSVSIWAQAVDSSLDIFAVVVTFLTVGYSSKPADQEHPFGHGKVEAIAAGIQSVLLLGASIAIAYAAVRHIMLGTGIEYAPAGVGVMLVSMVASILLSRYLFRVARATGSVALEANANNIRSDVYSTAGVLVGLAMVSFSSRLTIIDPIIALIVVALILRATYRVARLAFSELLDVKLPEAEENAIRLVIGEHFGETAHFGKVVDFHKLRTRKAGRQRYIDLHLVMPRNIKIDEAHQMCDHLERDIRHRLPHTDVTIHVEPCDEDCDRCALTCESRKKRSV